MQEGIDHPFEEVRIRLFWKYFGEEILSLWHRSIYHFQWRNPQRSQGQLFYQDKDWEIHLFRSFRQFSYQKELSCLQLHCYSTASVSKHCGSWLICGHKWTADHPRRAISRFLPQGSEKRSKTRILHLLYLLHYRLHWSFLCVWLTVFHQAALLLRLQRKRKRRAHLSAAWYSFWVFCENGQIKLSQAQRKISKRSILNHSRQLYLLICMLQ